MSFGILRTVWRAMCARDIQGVPLTYLRLFLQIESWNNAWTAVAGGICVGMIKVLPHTAFAIQAVSGTISAIQYA